MQPKGNRFDSQKLLFPNFNTTLPIELQSVCLWNTSAAVSAIQLLVLLLLLQRKLYFLNFPFNLWDSRFNYIKLFADLHHISSWTTLAMHYEAITFIGAYRSRENQKWTVRDRLNCDDRCTELLVVSSIYCCCSDCLWFIRNKQSSWRAISTVPLSPTTEARGEEESSFCEQITAASRVSRWELESERYYWGT